MKRMQSLFISLGMSQLFIFLLTFPLLAPPRHSFQDWTGTDYATCLIYSAFTFIMQSGLLGNVSFSLFCFVLYDLSVFLSSMLVP